MSEPRPEDPGHGWNAGLIAWMLLILAILATFFNIINPGADPMWQVYAFGLVFGFAGMGAFGIEPDLRPSSKQIEVLAVGIMYGAVLIAMQYVVNFVLLIPDLIFSTGQDLAILAPVSEELVFRMLIYGSLRAAMPDWDWYVAGIMSSVIFGLFHFFAFGVNIVSLVILTVGGMILAYGYEKTRDIGTPMVSHLINNTAGLVAVIAAFFFQYWWVGAVVIIAYVVWMFFGGGIRRR